MLLLFKANDCLRHIDRRLGSPVNTLFMTARLSNKAIAIEESRLGVRGFLRGLTSVMHVEIALFSWWLAREAGLLMRSILGKEV